MAGRTKNRCSAKPTNLCTGVPLKYTKMNSVIDMYVKLFHNEVSCFMFDELQTPPSRGKRSVSRTPWFAEEITFQPSKDLLIIPYSSGNYCVLSSTGRLHGHITDREHGIRAEETFWILHLTIYQVIGL